MREFRVHHHEFAENGVAVACVTHQSVESNHRWREKLALPYPLLSDEAGTAADTLAVVRHVPIGPWKLDLHRRSTFLVDVHGNIAAVWERVLRVRGHAAQVLALAKVASFPG